jgi:UDP-N-acetylmuramate dehydrogenase
MLAQSDLIQHNIPLAPYTTLGLGGVARYFAACGTEDDIRTCLDFAESHGLRIQILGGGSNTIFADEGFSGLVIHLASRGMRFEKSGTHTLAEVAAGELWHTFVDTAVESGLAGIECLAGIPGIVGATPVQNVGAYGQDVSEVIVAVTAIDRATRSQVTLNARECGFAYRQSRFKKADADRFVITRVQFRLPSEGLPRVQYPDVRKFFEQSGNVSWRQPGREGLTAVRNAVMTIRRKKSMVVDPADPNTRSVGSFFTNPILTPGKFELLKERYRRSGGTDQVSSFASGEDVKVPAAWLVEHAGFHKGYRSGNVGISEHHALALVNMGGTAAELLTLARQIQDRVEALFGIRLDREPIVVPST